MGRQRILRQLLMAVGVIAVVLGAVGVLVPLLPTTPFLLLAAACFMRSSNRLYGWLIHNRWLGDYILNYREYHAMTLRAKIGALVLLWGVIGYSALMVANSWWLRILLGTVATGVTVHLLCLRTLAVPRERHAGDCGNSEGQNRCGRATAVPGCREGNHVSGPHRWTSATGTGSTTAARM